jgi:hypothetical protein
VCGDGETRERERERESEREREREREPGGMLYFWSDFNCMQTLVIC